MLFSLLASSGYYSKQKALVPALAKQNDVIRKHLMQHVQHLIVFRWANQAKRPLSCTVCDKVMKFEIMQMILDNTVSTCLTRQKTAYISVLTAHISLLKYMFCYCFTPQSCYSIQMVSVLLYVFICKNDNGWNKSFQSQTVWMGNGKHPSPVNYIMVLLHRVFMQQQNDACFARHNCALTMMYIQNLLIDCHSKAGLVCKPETCLKVHEELQKGA